MIWGEAKKYELQILNQEGKLIKKIIRSCKRVRLSDQDKQELEERHNRSRMGGAGYKPIFPKYFPFIYMPKKGGIKKMVRRDFLRYLKVISALFLLCFCPLSELASKEVETVFFKEKGKVAQKWDELFTDHTLINFTYKNQPLSGFWLGQL